ncbi:MAG: hypothetical protein LBR00_02325, partial [Clostridiales Family XIII bacterium]|nr:hypothetical protein [Clostridiales Family XIII bacterium]
MARSRGAWMRLAVATIVLIVAGLIYAWSIFRAPLSAAFPGWTSTQMSLTFTLSITFYCLGGFFAGRLSHRLSVAAILRISAATLLAGFLCISFLLRGAGAVG